MTDEGKHSTSRGNSATKNAGGTNGATTIFATTQSTGRVPLGHSRGRVQCPHCRAPLKVRDSESLTPLCREIRYQCSNLECGGTYVADLTISRMIAPSQLPNPRIKLPVGPLTRARPVQAFAAAG